MEILLIGLVILVGGGLASVIVLVLGIWLPRPVERLMYGVADLSSSHPEALTAAAEPDQLHPNRITRRETQPAHQDSAAVNKETTR